MEHADIGGRQARTAIDRQIGRGGRLPKKREVPSSLDDLEPITWFVILEAETGDA